MRNKNIKIKSLWLKGRTQTEEEKIMQAIELAEKKEYDAEYLKRYYNYEM